MAVDITEAQFKEKKKEFITLGSELGLFDKNVVPQIEARLTDVDFIIDNHFGGDAATTYDKGTPTITVNTDWCCSNMLVNFNLDLVIFRELAKVANEIERELKVYKDTKIERFTKDYEWCFVLDESVDSPIKGLNLMGQVISEYTARAMIYRKYYKRENIPNVTEYARPENATFFDGYSEYSIFYRFINEFSRTIYRKEDPMFKLCKASFDHNLLDNIFTIYGQRGTDGNMELYKILGSIGYVSNMNRDNHVKVSKTMKKVFERIEAARNKQ
ncbi:MAG: hypothetical protein IKP98_01740 [Bacilli bacterium]|nr:hypothetical protein [Bacilli bacterium]